jgi:hypothetical protein
LAVFGVVLFLFLFLLLLDIDLVLLGSLALCGRSGRFLFFPLVVGNGLLALINLGGNNL